MPFPLAKNRKLRTLEKLEKMMKKSVFFQEKLFISFKIASWPNWEDAKFAGGRRLVSFMIKVS